MFGNIDRMIDNTGAHINSGGMRHHLNHHVMDEHIHHNGRPSPMMNPAHKMDHYGGDPYNFVDEMSSGNYTNHVAINNQPPPTTPTPVKKRGRRKKSDMNR